MLVFIFVYIDRGEPDPSGFPIEVEDLTYGKNIKEALDRLGITEKNFVRATFKENLLSFPTTDYQTFVNVCWGIRQKLLRKQKLAKYAKKVV